MAFSFGSSANTGAPAPSASAGAGASAGATGGFTFGAAAPSSGAPTPAAAASAPAASVPTFRASANTSNAPAPSTSTGPSAPAPTSTGTGTAFSFGGTSATSATTTATPAPTPATAAAAPTPATAGFSFGAPSAAPSTTAEPPAAAKSGTPCTLDVPDFNKTFGNFALYTKILKLSEQAQQQGEGSELAGQELVHTIHTLYKDQLAAPSMPDWAQPNASLRQQLTQTPTVSMADGSSTTLTSKVLNRILDLATELRITEAQATCLYAQVSREIETIQVIADGCNLLEQSGVSIQRYSPTTLQAREFYFYERHLKLQTLLFLVQSRLKGHGAILEATDILLQDGLLMNLIQLIRDYTHRIVQIMQELAASKRTDSATSMMSSFSVGTNTANTGSSSSTPKNPASFAKAHLFFCQQERHIAAEILFFVAYHTQWTGKEVCALIDLVKDLSALLPQPCPFNNVPSPYEASPTASHATAGWPHAPSTAPFTAPLKEKNFFVWQNELVSNIYESGQPQLLQCLSILLVAAMATMDTRQELWDRQAHSPNRFGTGNQLLPPDAPSASSPTMAELHAKLNSEAIEKWDRPDLGGWLSTSYVLLLRSAPNVLASPRSGGSDAQYRLAARAIHIPADLQSFTFARLTLLPALSRLPSSQLCNVSEFTLSVITEVYAHYLKLLPEGQLPMSRQRWRRDEEEGLRLRREDQARARQFMAWQNQGGIGAGSLGQAASTAEDSIPTSVDLMTRPDCLDDLVALATSLCSLGQNYARNFYTREISADGEVVLVPCRTLQELERHMARDDSLLPSYLSWLAALAHDKNSAQMVHNILSLNPESEAATNPSNSINWVKIVFNLRWYAQELSPYDNEQHIKSPTTSTTSTSTSNTSYYYNMEGNAMRDTSGASNEIVASGGTHSSTTSTTSSSSKLKELSDASRFQVSSHLAVIQNVAKYCTEAQYAILAITLPVDGISTQSALVGGDESLLVLFKLAIAPLSPALRGATLATIANLLRPLSGNGLDEKQKEFLLEQAKHGWEYLETCSLLPIVWLDQYHVLHQGAGDTRAYASLAFPPSSSALANAGSVPSMLPKDPNYGLFYELEHIESQMGWYPSTEGCLELLEALVCAAGCPSTLGQNWRLRPGATPYIEYVVDFILPRVLGIQNSPPLPFRTKSDRYRLVCKALAVIDAVLVRYDIPATALKLEGNRNLKAILGIQVVADSVVVGDANTNEQDLINDFKNIPVSRTHPVSDSGNATNNGTGNPTTSNFVTPTSVRVPMAKSPGFVVLADFLSSAGGTIFQAVAIVLTDQLNSNAFNTRISSQTDNAALSYAVFGNTPPTFASAKEGAKESGPTKPKQTLLKPLTALPQSVIMDSTTFDDGVSNREKSTILALKILCAAAAREETFFRAVSSAKETLTLVPVLRFQQIRFGSANLRAAPVSVSRLPNLLFSSNNSQYIRSSIFEYIGYKSADEERDSVLAGSALSAAFYMLNSLPHGYALRDICASHDEESISQPVATRLLIASRKRSSLDVQSTSLILHWMLDCLRTGSASSLELVQVLLGLPSMTSGGNWDPSNSDLPPSTVDCFDAILELFQDFNSNQTTEMQSTISLCFEVIFRVYDLLGSGDSLHLRIVLYTAERLRAVNFWSTKMLEWISQQACAYLPRGETETLENSNTDVLHGLAWLLKGVACELNLLTGFAGNPGIADAGFASLLSPRPRLFRDILSALFGNDASLASLCLTALPLKKLPLNPELTHPPPDALRAGIEIPPGAVDVVGGYECVNTSKILATLKGQYSEPILASMKVWCEEYNALVAHDCVSSHLSAAIYMLLQSAVANADSFQTGGVGQSEGLMHSSVVNIMAIMVQVILRGSDDNFEAGMDANLYPNATRNLSNAILVFAEMVTDRDGRPHLDEVDLHTVASLLARATAYSMVGPQSELQSPIQYERTAVLGSALSLVLQAADKAEPYLLIQHRREYVLAAKALAKLASLEVSSGESEARNTVAILVRSSLAITFEVCSDIDDNRAESFLNQSMVPNHMKSFLALVSKGDSNICALLQTAALQPHGSEILLNSGICQSLEVAAKAHQRTEAQLETKRDNLDFAFNTARSVSPEFLLGHLKLLSTMMASPTLPGHLSATFPRHVLQILLYYKTTFKRLCCNFPAEADVLRAFIRCLEQATCLAYPADSGGRRAEQPLAAGDSFKDSFSAAGFFESGLVMLCEQLLEHPLPNEILPSLPQCLDSSKFHDVAGNASVRAEKQRTWWDVLNTLLDSKECHFSFLAPVGRDDFGYWGRQTPKKWTENTFEYAIVATNILTMGLTIMKKLNVFELLKSQSVAVGLYQYTLASQAIQSRMNEISPSRSEMSMMYLDDESFQHTELEAAYLTTFGSSVAQCAEQILITTYNMLGDSKENAVATFPKRVYEAIEQSGLNNKGIGCLETLEQGSERTELAKLFTTRMLLEAKQGL